MVSLLYVSEIPKKSWKLTDQGLELTEEDMQVQLSRRRPGQSDITTAVC